MILDCRGRSLLHQRIASIGGCVWIDKPHQSWRSGVINEIRFGCARFGQKSPVGSFVCLARRLQDCIEANADKNQYASQDPGDDSPPAHAARMLCREVHIPTGRWIHPPTPGRALDPVQSTKSQSGSRCRSRSGAQARAEAAADLLPAWPWRQADLALRPRQATSRCPRSSPATDRSRPPTCWQSRSRLTTPQPLSPTVGVRLRARAPKRALPEGMTSTPRPAQSARLGRSRLVASCLLLSEPLTQCSVRDPAKHPRHSDTWRPLRVPETIEPLGAGPSGIAR